MILQTQRLHLRRFTTNDLDLIVEINNHPECIRFNRWDSMSVEDCQACLNRWIAQYDSTLPGCGVFCVEDKEHEKIGMAFLLPYGDDSYEIGFRLRRCQWEKGYATEISRGLMAYAKEQLHAVSIVGEVFRDNIRSRRVFEKLNFSCSPHTEGADGLIYHYQL